MWWDYLYPVYGPVPRICELWTYEYCVCIRLYVCVCVCIVCLRIVWSPIDVRKPVPHRTRSIFRVNSRKQITDSHAAECRMPRKFAKRMSKKKMKKKKTKNEMCMNNARCVPCPFVFAIHLPMQYELIQNDIIRNQMKRKSCYVFLFPLPSPLASLR